MILVRLVKLGPPQLLICLYGSVKIETPQTALSLNIEVWLPRAFPLHPPIIYVIAVPPEQQLRPTPFVDQTGRFHHNYLNYWTVQPNSNIVEAIRLLLGLSAQQPPIYMTAPPAPVHKAPQPPAAPPVSANIVELREALRKRLNERMKRLQRDVAIESDQILAKSTMLGEGETNLKKGLAMLTAQLKRIEEERSLLLARQVSLTRQIEQLSSGGDIDIDHFVLPQGPIAQELTMACIKDHAIQDTIYESFKWLERRKTSLPEFIARTRELAREQFMERAMLLKIRRDFPVFE